MIRKPGQIMEKKRYKQFVKRFKNETDKEAILEAVRDWFDAGGGADETFDQATVFARVMAFGDDTLVDRAVETLQPWNSYRSDLAIGAAIDKSDPMFLKRLLDLGASLTTSEAWSHHVTAAAARGSIACLDMLLEHGASIDGCATSGYTPLQVMALGGNVRGAKLLLERGADPTVVAQGIGEGMTALQLARKHDHSEVAKLLADTQGGQTAEQSDGASLQDEFIEPEKISAAIDEVRTSSVADAAWFGKNIPDDPLRTAIETYAARAADEKALALAASVSSGKSGILLTDKAMYFSQTLGNKQQRIPYRQIKAVAKDRDHLRISTDWDTLDWDLSETLLWENSRRRIADLVSAILQKILQPEDQPVAAETRGSEAVEASAPSRVSVEIEEPVDWPRVYAFHAPIVLLGMPLVMPAAYALIGASGLAGDDFARGIASLGYVQFLTLGAMALAPSMYAFGVRLQFSLGKFIIASALIAFLSIQAMTTALRAGSGAFPISFGGGLFGILVASGLGSGGVAVYRLVTGRAANVDQ